MAAGCSVATAAAEVLLAAASKRAKAVEGCAAWTAEAVEVAAVPEAAVAKTAEAAEATAVLQKAAARQEGLAVVPAESR